MKLRQAQVEVATTIMKRWNLDLAGLPKWYRDKGPGRGYLGSISIVVASAVVASLFSFLTHFHR